MDINTNVLAAAAAKADMIASQPHDNGIIQGDVPVSPMQIACFDFVAAMEGHLAFVDEIMNSCAAVQAQALSESPNVLAGQDADNANATSETVSLIPGDDVKQDIRVT